MKKSTNLFIQNKKAYHEYFIDETYEAGIELVGTEVKSIRQGKANLKDSYAVIKKGEIYICGMHITPYEQGNIFNKDPLRDRKLLMHKYEINKLAGQISQKGLTLIPTKLYFKNDKIKIELGLGRGKKNYDKRQDIAKRDAQREIDRRMKNNF